MNQLSVTNLLLIAMLVAATLAGQVFACVCDGEQSKVVQSVAPRCCETADEKATIDAELGCGDECELTAHDLDRVTHAQMPIVLSAPVANLIVSLIEEPVVSPRLVVAEIVRHPDAAEPHRCGVILLV